MEFTKQHHRFILTLLLLGLAGRLFAQDYQAGVIYLKIADTSNVEITFPPPTNFSGDVALIYQIFDDYDVTEVEKPFAVLATTRLERIYRVYFDESKDVSAFIAALSMLDIVEYSEQVPQMKLLSTVPNDPLISQQFHLDQIQAFDAFDLHQGGNATVAIVDDGVLTTHEDLADNIVAGWDVADDDSDPNPPLQGVNAANPSGPFSHGTWVAGVAGAVTNNSIGVASIGWSNRIMPVKVIKDDTEYPLSAEFAFEGVAWAAANGADVINMSFAGPGDSEAEYDVLVAARQAGAILVAGAGNQGTIPQYPAAYGEGFTNQPWYLPDRYLVIAVANIDANGDMNPYSSFGGWVDISAYGTSILTTAAGSSNGDPLNDLYTNPSGTSISSPLVAGLVGLMISYNPTASDDDIINCLINTANDDIYGPSHPFNVPGTLGNGRIDAFAALRCLASDCADDPIAVISPSEMSICPDGEVDITANNGIAFLWSTNETTRTITVDQPGTYSVTVTFPGNCTATASVDIDPAITEAFAFPLENSGQYPNDGIVCSSYSVEVAVVEGSSYLWNFGSTYQSDFRSFSPPATWNYSVTVTDVGGCAGVTDVVSGTIYWYEPPVASIEIEEDSETPDDGIICFGSSITLTATGGATYLWTTGATTESITLTPTSYGFKNIGVSVTDANGCMSFTTIWFQVIYCPLQAFDCPCTDANTLNIEADENGSTYSTLEAANNYDQNNDGILDASEHNGCIAIVGQLVIDEDLTITGCPDIRMQPCAEIVVRPYRQLSMKQNAISGCETMWKGITVESLGRLIFQDNNPVEDAQHAITAYGSILTLPSTTIQIQRNKFIRNHIGVYVPGPQFSVVAHMPFTKNIFIGDGTQALLPPCDQNLPNWDADNGYAGVVSRYVDFSVGNATDNSISNTFSALRNGVIGESCWLQVHHASFSDMVGEWVSPNAPPTLASSFGVGILANIGRSTVRDCVFDGCSHGIFSNNVLVTALDNDMPEVRRGMEILSPYSCQLWDNEDIAFRNRGILVRDPQVNSFLSSWLRFDINRNDLSNFDQNDGGDIAIEIRGANGVYLPNARMSENEIFLDAAESSILVNGTDHWTLDDNFIQHRALPNQQNSFGLGVQLQASRHNYLYDNTVEDIANTPGTRAFHTSQSTDNTFCCNNTSGNSIAYSFFGTCAPTALRTSDLAGHQTCLEISQGSSIGEQGVFDPITLTFPNYGNLFYTGSGTARNWGITNDEIAASFFHVLSDQTPDRPATIDLPNISNPLADLWFDEDGVGEQDCADCPVPPQLPVGRSEIIDENDRITAGTGFGTATQRHEALQWENSRNLYRRMREYAALHNQDSLVDAFYANALSGRIAEYYEADSLVRDVSVLSPSVSQGMETAIQGILQADSLIRLRLVTLGTAVGWADSLEIYRQADSIRMDAAVFSRDLVAYIDTARTERKTKAVAAIQVASALDAEEILERNRKDVLVIYCQTIGQENYQLNTTQAETIADIAYQCPDEGGSAVYLARAIYQLVEPTEFDDTILCGSEERSVTGTNSSVKPAFDFVLKPNPTSGSASIIGLERAGSQSVQVTLRHVSGRLVLEKQFDLPNEALNFMLDVLSPGIYFCHVRVGTQTETRKLILIR